MCACRAPRLECMRGPRPEYRLQYLLASCSHDPVSLEEHHMSHNPRLVPRGALRADWPEEASWYVLKRRVRLPVLNRALAKGPLVCLFASCLPWLLHILHCMWLHIPLCLLSFLATSTSASAVSA